MSAAGLRCGATDRDGQVGMSVVVRTHGGLGNQLFQLFYARLYARDRRAPLRECHDIRYRHAFPRSGELDHAIEPGPATELISAFRIPKIMTRLKLGAGSLNLLGTTFLDGYFQQPADYASFHDTALRRELIRLRTELGVAAVPDRDVGMHLRLGDFFSTDAALLDHLENRLRRLRAGVAIITNEEERLSTPAVASKLAAAGAYIVPTGDMTAEQVLRTLASFREVDGNESTLLFWASVLSGMHCEFRSPNLHALRARFRGALQTTDIPA